MIARLVTQRLTTILIQTAIDRKKKKIFFFQISAQLTKVAVHARDPTSADALHGLVGRFGGLRGASGGARRFLQGTKRMPENAVARNADCQQNIQKLQQFWSQKIFKGK